MRESAEIVAKAVVAAVDTMLNEVDLHVTPGIEHRICEAVYEKGWTRKRLVDEAKTAVQGFGRGSNPDRQLKKLPEHLRDHFEKLGPMRSVLRAEKTTRKKESPLSEEDRERMLRVIEGEK